MPVDDTSLTIATPVAIPTPLTMKAEDHTAMLTLGQDSFSIVMTSINHAKLKGHCQVQPLHVAAALLDPLTRSPALHNACLQSLKDPSHPLKCDALDLCFKVALERLPVITDPQKCKDQTMSNALAAALKRAHANERKGTPEQSLQPLLAVKTGTAHLTISILDDPSVSRVFKEAGFSSTDVKNNLEEAVAQAALASPPPPPPSLDNTGMRRVQLAMPGYCSPRMDSVQFRNSFCPGPSPFVAGEPATSHGRLLERGRMSHNVLDMQPERERSYVGASAHAGATVSPPFLDCALEQQKRHEHVRLLGRTMDNPLRSCTSLYDADVCKIVETLLSGPKKRNPVLLGDSGLQAVLKEFSQRLTRGDIPSLRGVKSLDLPFRSLSVGILSEELVEQKLARLKRDVDGCMRTGGAIITVGDLQWLVEPTLSISSLVLEALERMISSHTYNRLWLLATASPKLFDRCQLNSHPSLERLGLQPVQLASDSSEFVVQPRNGSHECIKNVEIAFFSQMGAGWAPPPAAKPAVESGLETADCCHECKRKFQQECALLMREGQTLSLLSGPSPDSSGIEFNEYGNGLSGPPGRHPQLPWLHNQKDKSWPPVPVKEEENLGTQKFQEIRRKWEQNCSDHHMQPENVTSGSPGSLRDHSASPVSEVVSPEERNPRTVHSLHSSCDSLKWSPQTLKTANAKSEERSPLHARIARGNMPIFLSSPRTAVVSVTRDAEVKRYDDSGGAPFSWMRRDQGFAAGTAVSMKSTSLVARAGHPGAPVGTDLALRAHPAALSEAHSRDLREDGQLPLRSRSQLLGNSKSLKSGPHSAMIRPSDAERLSGLCWSLSNSVAWQKEAVGAVASTVVKCRSGEGRKTGAYARTDTWLLFLGPDRVGKREVAKALAKLVFQREENLIVVSEWQSQTGSQSSPGIGIPAADRNGTMYRGRTALDRMVEAVSRKPHSVVLLVDFDRADVILRKSLLKAMEKGKLSDSNGREVSLANNIFIMTCEAGADLLTHHQTPLGKKPIEFDEEKLSGLGPRQVRLLIDNTTSSKVLYTRGTGWSVVEGISGKQHMGAPEERRPAETILLFGSPVFKRKADAISGNDGLSGTHSSPERRYKKEPNSPSCSSRGFSLDLNLSAEENLSEEAEPCITEELCETSEPESLSELTAKVVESAREVLDKSMFGLLDASVVFKPFNLNGLTEWVLEKIDSSLEDVMQTMKAPVEIDRALLEVMVSSAWQKFSNPDNLQGWIDNVLMKAVSGILEEVSRRPDFVMKFSLGEKTTMMSTFANSAPMACTVDLLPREIQIDR